MKLFVYEHITSGALAEHQLPTSLANEGDQMLLAALKDCHDTQRCTLFTQRDSRLNDLDIVEQNPNYYCHPAANLIDYRHAWNRCLNQCDAVLIIAPETNAILATLQQR
ncbi:MAG: putative ATP-grasp superfamily ATP-dependent carboligase, partial [Methylophagaceae bacterium]